MRNPDLRDDVAAIGTRAGRTEVVAPDAFVDRGPFDVVLELIGAPNIASDLDALAVGGRIVVIGLGGGANAELNLLTLMGEARPHPRLGAARLARSRRRPAAVQLVEAHVLPFLRDDEHVAPGPGGGHVPDGEAEAAYDRFVAGGKLGKIVLTSD